MFGNCWLACLGELRLLVVNRWLEPGSEFHMRRQWFVDSAMGELLESDEYG